MFEQGHRIPFVILRHIDPVHRQHDGQQDRRSERKVTKQATLDGVRGWHPRFSNFRWRASWLLLNLYENVTERIARKDNLVQPTASAGSKLRGLDKSLHPTRDLSKLEIFLRPSLRGSSVCRRQIQMSTVHRRHYKQ